MVSLVEANLNKGRVGTELEMLVRKDVMDANTPLGKAFKGILATSGFVFGMDQTIVRHDLSSDVYYSEFETANVEMQGAKWSELQPRLLRVLAWLKQKDQVWLDRRSKRVFLDVKNTSDPDLIRTFLPRAKMPNNPSCGLHLHFHSEDWFNDLDHAVSFVELWNYAMEVFREEVLPSRYEKGDESYTPQGEDYATFTPLHIPEPQSIEVLKKEWAEMGDADPEGKNAYMVKRILKWMAKNRWTAINLTKVDVRKDVEFRFMHGTLNMETITHWMNLLVALIEAAEIGDVRNFRRYLTVREPDIEKEHEKRAAKMAVSDTSHANIWHPPAHASRAINKLLTPPGDTLQMPKPKSKQPVGRGQWV